MEAASRFTPQCAKLDIHDDHDRSCRCGPFLFRVANLGNFSKSPLFGGQSLTWHSWNFRFILLSVDKGLHCPIVEWLQNVKFLHTVCIEQIAVSDGSISPTGDVTMMMTDEGLKTEGFFLQQHNHKILHCRTSGNDFFYNLFQSSDSLPNLLTLVWALHNRNP